jgi:hypothetical protein
MKKFKSITVPAATYDALNNLKSRITKTPLSISKVVTIVTQDYPTIHEKAQSNENHTYTKKSCIR